jgi:hypothetical protein
MKVAEYLVRPPGEGEVRLIPFEQLYWLNDAEYLGF